MAWSDYRIILLDKNGNRLRILRESVDSVTWEYKRVGGCGDMQLVMRDKFDDYGTIEVYYHDHKDITYLLEIKKNVDKSLENLIKSYIKCGFKFKNNKITSPKEWSNQKIDKKLKIAGNLTNNMNRRQGLNTDVIVNGKREELTEPRWVNKNDFQCLCNNIIKNIGNQFDVKYKKGIKEAKIKQIMIPLHLKIVCNECYREYEHFTMISHEKNLNGIGFRMSEEEMILFRNMNKEEQIKYLLEKKIEVESDRKFHLEWSLMNIEQITEF